jgi:hypothetical protein
MTTPITPEQLQAEPHHDYGDASINARPYRLLEKHEIKEANYPLLAEIEQFIYGVWDHSRWRAGIGTIYRTKLTEQELRKLRGLEPEEVAPAVDAPQGALLAESARSGSRLGMWRNGMTGSDLRQYRLSRCARFSGLFKICPITSKTPTPARSSSGA